MVQHSILSLAFPIIGMLCFWLGLIWWTIQFSGLDKLCHVYGYRDRFHDKTYLFSFVYIGSLRFRGALTVGVNGEGLYLKYFFAALFGYPPIFIPWTDVRTFREESQAWLNYYVFSVPCPAPITLKIPTKAFTNYPEISEYLLTRSQSEQP